MINGWRRRGLRPGSVVSEATDRRGPQTFGYDTLDRLTSASHPLLGTPQAFAYDAVGNRTTGGSVVNAGNQLTADVTHSYQYDDRRGTAWIVPRLERFLASTSRYERSPVLLNMLPDLTR